MTAVFWSIALLLTAGAVLLLLPPLLRARPAATRPADPQQARLAVFDQQLRDLEADLANGLLDASQFERARTDLERGLLEDSVDTQPSDTGVVSPSWPTAAVLVLGVPALALATYLQVGSGPAGLEPARETPAMVAPGEHDMDRLLEGLRTRLQGQPDPQGWALLARSQVSLGRMEEALESYARAVELGGNRDPAVLAQYADLLATATGSLQGRPMELVQQALELDPDHLQSLWLAGTAAYRDQDYPVARRHGERLLANLPPGSEGALSIEANLRELSRLQGGGP